MCQSCNLMNASGGRQSDYYSFKVECDRFTTYVVMNDILCVPSHTKSVYLKVSRLSNHKINAKPRNSKPFWRIPVTHHYGKLFNIRLSWILERYANLKPKIFKKITEFYYGVVKRIIGESYCISQFENWLMKLRKFQYSYFSIAQITLISINVLTVNALKWLSNDAKSNLQIINEKKNIPQKLKKKMMTQNWNIYLRNFLKNPII